MIMTAFTLTAFDNITYDGASLCIFVSSTCKACSYLYDAASRIEEGIGYKVVVIDIDRSPEIMLDQSINNLQIFIQYNDSKEEKRQTGNINIETIINLFKRT